MDFMVVNLGQIVKKTSVFGLEWSNMLQARFGMLWSRALKESYLARLVVVFQSQNAGSPFSKILIQMFSQECGCHRLWRTTNAALLMLKWLIVAIENLESNLSNDILKVEAPVYCFFICWRFWLGLRLKVRGLLKLLYQIYLGGYGSMR